MKQQIQKVMSNQYRTMIKALEKKFTTNKRKNCQNKAK